MMLRRLVTAFGLLASLLAFSAFAVACGDDEDSADGERESTVADGGPAKPEAGKVVLGTQPWIGYGPLTAIAPQEGLFDERGLDEVEIVNFKSDNDINAAFASGRLDAVSVGISQALTFAEAGVPVKVVLLEDISNDADAILGRGVDSVADLKGKKVAVEVGTVGDMMLRYALGEEGLSIDDVEVVPLPAADAGTAIIAGRVDAAVTYEPYITEAVTKSDGIEPIFTAGEREGLISDMLIVSEEMIDDRPGQIDALVRAWGDAVEFYRSNPEEGQRLIAEDLGTDVAELETAFDGVEFFDLEQNAEQFSGPFPELVDEVQTIMVDSDLLDGPVDVGELVDGSFVEAFAGGN